MLTIDDAREAAALILGRYQSCHLERLRELRAGACPAQSIDCELGAVRRTDGTIYQRGLVHSYGGGRSPTLSALTPLGRAVLDLFDPLPRERLPRGPL